MARDPEYAAGFSDRVLCDACGRTGKLPSSSALGSLVRAPEGWFWSETKVRGDCEDEMVVVLACSEICKATFWRGDKSGGTLEEALVDFFGRQGMRLERVGSSSEDAWKLRAGFVGTKGTFLQCVRLGLAVLLDRYGKIDSGEDEVDGEPEAPEEEGSLS